MIDEFNVVSYEEAKRHPILKHILLDDLFGIMDKMHGYFYVHEGNLHLQNDLILESDELDKLPDGEPAIGFIVTGNLTLDCSVLNETGDYGPALYVGGNLICCNLLIGGAPTRIIGDIQAKEVIMLHYNHGWMQCDGTISAKIMIVEDYHLMPFQKVISHFYFNDRDPESPEEYELIESQEGNTVIPEKLRLLLNNVLTTDFEEIRRDLAAGESVIKGQERTQDYWQTKVQHNWRDLKRVPMTMRTPSICKEAMGQNVGALQYFPFSTITIELAQDAVQLDGRALRYLPDELITFDLCYLAAENGAILGTDIPEKFYDFELLNTIIQKSDWQMERVPEVFITEDLLVLYVKTGRGAWLDKYCKQSGVSKQKVLERVIVDDIKYLHNIFGWHLSSTTFAFAKQFYDRLEYTEDWKRISEQFDQKITRLSSSFS